MAKFFWNTDLKLLEFNIHDVYKILCCSTPSNFQPPMGELVKAECYFVIIQESRAQYVSYIVFRDPGINRNYVYEYQSIPFSSSDLPRVEEEGMEFCDEMGFHLVETDIWTLKEMERNRVFQEMGIFTDWVTGEFSVRPSSSRMIADGKSLVTICSDPLVTVSGFAPRDGTPFWVRANLGEVVGDVLDSGDKSWLLPVKDGVLYFQLRAPESKGQSLIQVASEDQKAHASTLIRFDSGPPHGKIGLKISANFLIADMESSVEIASDNIHDACGNLVTDGSEIAVSATLGRIVADNHYFKDNNLVLPTELGRIKFRFIAGSETGLAEVRAGDLAGQAEGMTKILLIPGTPSGNFPIKPESKHVAADGETVVSLDIGPIHDRYGNIVADEQLMLLETSAGMLLQHPDEEKGEQSLKLPTVDGKIKAWFKAANKPGNVHISARNFDRTAAGSCTLALYQPS
jgi:hypothetical protein